jgi:hypothetical protein
MQRYCRQSDRVHDHLQKAGKVTQPGHVLLTFLASKRGNEEHAHPERYENEKAEHVAAFSVYHDALQDTVVRS